MANCNFLKSEEHGETCSQTAYGGHPTCIFHSGGRWSDVFAGHLDIHIAEGNGNWRYFQFPSGFRLENQDINFEVDLSGAQLNEVVIRKVNFTKTVKMNDVVSDRRLSMLQVTFSDVCELRNAVLNDVNWDHVMFLGGLEAPELLCRGDFNFRGSAVGEDNHRICFNESRFYGAARFVGRRDQYIGAVNAAEIVYCLTGEVHFSNVEFFEPARSRFFVADFRQARISGTNFEGISLVNTLWPVGDDGRMKIYDDIWTRQNTEKSFQDYVRHSLETQYRSLRRTHEAQKDYGIANDFYVGEMDLRRQGYGILRKYFFSLNTIYRYLSYYGTGPGRAVLVFLFLSAIYALISTMLAPPPEESLLKLGLGEWKGGYVPDWLQAFLGIWVDGIQIMILKESSNVFGLGGLYIFLDSLARILGPIQVAMIVISFRNMIKRG